MRTNKLIDDLRSGAIKLHKEAVDPRSGQAFQGAMSDVQSAYEELINAVEKAEIVVSRLGNGEQKTQFSSQLNKVKSKIKSRF